MQADCGNLREIYKELNQIYGPQHDGVAPVKSADGSTLLTEPSTILKRWDEHFDTILNQPSSNRRGAELYPCYTTARRTCITPYPANCAIGLFSHTRWHTTQKKQRGRIRRTDGQTDEFINVHSVSRRKNESISIDDDTT